MTDNAADPTEPEIDWRTRCQTQYNQEWQISQELLELGRILLGLARQEPHSAAFLIQVHRLLELGAELGRHSTDAAITAMKAPGAECRECCAARKEFEAAIQKAYGHKVAEAETDSLNPAGTPPPSSSTVNPQPPTK